MGVWKSADDVLVFFFLSTFFLSFGSVWVLSFRWGVYGVFFGGIIAYLFPYLRACFDLAPSFLTLFFFFVFVFVPVFGLCIPRAGQMRAGGGVLWAGSATNPTNHVAGTQQAILLSRGRSRVEVWLYMQSGLFLAIRVSKKCPPAIPHTASDIRQHTHGKSLLLNKQIDHIRTNPAKTPQSSSPTTPAAPPHLRPRPTCLLHRHTRPAEHTPPVALLPSARGLHSTL